MESGLGLVELKGNIDVKRIAIYSFSKLIFFTLSHKAVILIFVSYFFDNVDFHWKLGLTADKSTDHGKLVSTCQATEYE